MHYGEMPRATLGSSDLRSQVAIFGEWNIYGTRKKSFVKFQTRIWKKNVQLTKSWKTIKKKRKANCPKLIDIKWKKHWNVRQNILTWRWWMNDKITWRHARIVPTLFLCLFHWMSINLGQFAFLFFFIVFQLFVSWTFFFQIRVWNLTKDFFRVP
jgi:hypothetical protein